MVRQASSILIELYKVKENIEEKVAASWCYDLAIMEKI